MKLLDKSIARRAFAIAWPLVVSEAIDSILSIIDVFFVSRLGDEAVAGVGLATYVSWLFFVAIQPFYIGSLVLVSQAYGGKRYAEASRALGEALVGAVVLAIGVAALGVHVSKQLLGVLGGPRIEAEALAYAIDYFVVRVVGLPLLAATLIYGALFRAIGFTKPVLVITTVAAITNAVLDPILIFGLLGLPAMGVRGAALASIAATATALALSIIFAKRLPIRARPYLPTTVFAKIVSVGLPAGVERLVFTLGNTLYIGAIARCGDDALAAHTIGLRIEALAYLPAFAFSIAATSLVGQSIGAGRIGEAKNAGMTMIKLNTLFMAATGAILALAAPWVPHFFAESEEVAKLATLYLLLAAVSEPALGAAMAASSSIRGAGNTIVPMMVNVASLYGARVAPAYALASTVDSNYCPLTAWVAMDIDLALRAATLILIYRKRFEKLARRLVG